MLSKSQNKLLRSLQRKKARQEHSLFLVEGGKAVSELLGSGWRCTACMSVTVLLLHTGWH